MVGVMRQIWKVMWDLFRSSHGKRFVGKLFLLFVLRLHRSIVEWA